MTYRTARIAFGILVLQVPRVYGQTEAPRPQFDVASIKLNPDCGNRAGRGGGQNPFSTGRLNMECVTLERLIQLAYGTFADGASPNMQMLQISGGSGLDTVRILRLGREGGRRRARGADDGANASGTSRRPI